MRAVLDLTEAAYYVNLREKMLLKLVDEGKIPHRKIGKLIRFLRHELDAWLDAQPGILQAHPVKNTDTHQDSTRTPRDSHDPVTPPVKLVRGARTHVSADSAGSQSR